jgi:hypothetical protein
VYIGQLYVSLDEKDTIQTSASGKSLIFGNLAINGTPKLLRRLGEALINAADKLQDAEVDAEEVDADASA